MRFPLIVLLGLSGCAGPAASIVAPSAQLSIKEERLEESAAARGINLEASTALDLGFDAANPPPDYWAKADNRDRAAAQWATLCASCHGAKGTGENVPKLEPAPRAFGGMGMAMGFLMGGNKMRGGIFTKIRDGGETMPAFQDQLTNEDIWGLVYFIEHL
jgi:mono/diheme cytochrome c family protein